MNWKQIREQEVEECLDRWRAEHVAEEGFDVSIASAKTDSDVVRVVNALHETLMCDDEDCTHLDCAVVADAVDHLMDYLSLRDLVRAHRDSKPGTVPTGAWSAADRRLWDFVGEQ